MHWQGSYTVDKDHNEDALRQELSQILFFDWCDLTSNSVVSVGDRSALTFERQTAG